MPSLISALNPFVNRMESAPTQENPIPERPERLNPTSKKIAALALICFAAFLIVGPTVIIKGAALSIGLTALAALLYTLWQNRQSSGEDQPSSGSGIRGLRGSGNQGNIPTGGHTGVNSGHVNSSDNTTPGGGHTVKKTTIFVPAPNTSTTHTQIGARTTTGTHTEIGNRAKK